MRYMLLIHQGTALDRWDEMTPEEQRAVYEAYKAVEATPGVTAGQRMQPPETATTVRVEGGRTLVTDGPFAETREALGGYLFLEADHLDAAIELAARIPAARLGGAVEVRPLAGA